MGGMELKYMKEAIKQAKKAYAIGEVPVGAVIVKDGKIIARAYNTKETKQNPLHHAEILAIEKAAKKLASWRLEDVDMYITLEPCMMCAGAILQARVKNVYIGALDSKTGAIVSKAKAFDEYIVNHKVNYEVGILEDECSKILKDFFKTLRKG